MPLVFPLDQRPLHSDNVKNQFPAFYHDDAQTFMLFVKAYYEYMEQEGKLQYELNNVEGYKDIDLTLESYIDYFRKTVLPSIPIDVLADKRLLVKTIRDFYQSKGTIDSYRFLFRALYNEDIEVNYPSDKMLIVSEGDFRLDRYLVISSDEQAYKFIGRTIQGLETLAEGFVEGVVRRSIGGRDLMQILISRVKGTFKQDENIKIKADASGSGFEPEIEVGISTITIKSKGAEYAAGDKVDLISSQTGDFGKGVVTSVENQAGIVIFSIDDGGSGYAASTESPGSIISLVGGDGTTAASFIISGSDITDTFAISRCTTLIGANTLYSNSAPTIGSQKMGDFANTILASPVYGFPESGETVTMKGVPFRTNTDAVMKIATTSGHNLVVGQSLYGVTSGANAVIKTVVDNTVGAAIYRVDTFKNFTGTENIKIAKATGNTIGTLVSGKFFANTTSSHKITIGNVNSQTISVGDELVGTRARFGVGNTSIIGDVGGGDASSKNVHSFVVVKSVVSTPNGYVHNGTANTTQSGTVSSSGNTVTGSGTAFTSNFEVGDEIKAGGQTGRRIVSIASDTSLVTASQFNPVLASSSAYGKGGNYRTLLTLQVTANTTANLTSQFDAGPMLPFVETEGIRKVGSATIVANSAAGSANSTHENIYTKLQDSLLFETGTFGTIGDLSLEIGGTGHSVAPKVTVTNPTIQSLSIRDVFLTLQNTAPNWATGNSNITTFDTNDRLVQSSTGAKADIKQIPPATPEQFPDGLTTTTDSAGVIQTTVRVFQDDLQAASNIKFANNTNVTVNFYTDASQTTLSGTGVAKIVSIADNGVLGQNADISASVGANGAITAIRTLDSGFAYKPNETVTFSSSGRDGASSGTGQLTLSGAANSEGFYTTSKGHISSSRAFIQDSFRYQEFSYELSSGIAFNKYKDFVTNLVHPAGMKLFGQFQTRQVNDMDLTTTPVNRKRLKGTGTVSITKTKASNTVSLTNNSFNITGSGGGLFRGAANGVAGNTTRIANNKFMIVEVDPGNGIANKFYTVRVANATSATAANLENKWTFGTVSAANVYFANSFVVVGSGTAFNTQFANGDTMIIGTDGRKFHPVRLNKVINATRANTSTLWTDSNISSANVFYYTGV